MPYKFSPSTLGLLDECQKCFWLHFNKNIKRPAGIFPSLPSGMDMILKAHFDSHRDKKELPPELSGLKDVKLFDNMELLSVWRNNLKGIKWTDENGNIIDYNDDILSKWEQYDINYIIKQKPDAFKQVHLLLNCAINDEFGLTDGVKKIHETLLEHGIEHQFEIYSDPKVELTPHMLGIGYHILPGIRFCIEKFKKN